MKFEMSSLLKSMIAVAGLVATVGCKGIPNAYLGEYQDSNRQVKLELDTYEGTLRFADGRKVSAKLEELKYDLLKDGKRALYARPSSRDEKMIEIFLVQPNMSTRQEGGGLLWYESEIVFSLINSKDDNAAKNITLVHCQRGVVLLDTQTQRVQLGCPEGPERIDLKKTKDGGRRDDDWPGGSPG